ncbi:ABC transporter ATP-binding protein [Okibacterium fritillariae]|uniref:Sulfonate transport system ATP-binding protein n=1 Tax=Okibacterium fritillariae TaxID=123320 RepID=A0A1T5KYQ7_9MICO|nr:ABC transporter ATP-binding protein [Okibacterium fritillariae]SKC68854.1 sulfonate transport system ATP-binding protein [Okibacterium fritillariae]
MATLTSTTAANTAFSVRFDGLSRSFPVEKKRGRAASTTDVATPAWGERTVLRDIDLTIAPGEVVAILGTSGCGKSTLLRIAGGLDTASTGDAFIGDQPVAGTDGRTAIGFQEPRLLPWRSVTDNVAIGLPPGTDKKAGAERVATLIDLVGLGEFAGHRPREISGGMAQRTSLARALARNPGVLLLDEPFGALDALTRLKMQDLLLDIHRAAPTTVLLVTHDVDEALQLADRVILLGREDGRDGSTIVETLTVPGERPRDRGSADLAELRGRLLDGLGIDRHTRR